MLENLYKMQPTDLKVKASGGGVVVLPPVDEARGVYKIVNTGNETVTIIPKEAGSTKIILKGEE